MYAAWMCKYFSIASLTANLAAIRLNIYIHDIEYSQQNTQNRLCFGKKELGYTVIAT